MEHGLCWQMILHETPRRVFCALVQVTTKHGRLCGVHDFGRTLRFTPQRGLAGPVLEIRLTSYLDGSTLLEVVAADTTHAEVPVEAESIGSLVHQLREHFHTTPPTMMLAA